MSLTKIKHHFRKNDSIIFNQLKIMELKVLTPPKSSHLFFRKLCREIIAQQLAGSAAQAITKRFNNLLQNRVTPSRVLSFKDKHFRNVGLSWAKARYILDLADKVKTREVELSNLHKLEDSLVVEELVKVKGIGPWTAEMFLIFTLGREDVFSFGDLGLNKGLQKLYGFKSKPTQNQIKKIIKSWSPYKSYASLALWSSLN